MLFVRIFKSSSNKVPAMKILLLPIIICSFLVLNVQAYELAPKIVGIESFSLTDSNRDGRPIIYDVWYPTSEQNGSSSNDKFWQRPSEVRELAIKDHEKKFPLIVFSHANFADRHMSSWFAEILSSNGYIVAAVDHFGNTAWEPNAWESIQIWNRPKDISFMMDHLLNDSPFKSYIDTDKIGISGYSLGGMTAIWMLDDLHFLKEASFEAVYAIASEEFSEDEVLYALETTSLKPLYHSYKDSRIKAAFIMAPAGGDCFSEEDLKKIKAPVQFVVGSHDNDTPSDKNAYWFKTKIKNAKLNSIPEGTHYIFLNKASFLGKWILPEEMYEDKGPQTRDEIHHSVGTQAIDFFNQVFSYSF